MDSPGSRALPPKNSPARPWPWIPSTSCTWPATPWMNAADAFSKNSTIGAVGPQIPSTRPAGCLYARSCLFTARQQHQILDLFSSDEHVALEVTWSVYQNIIDAYRSSNARGGKTLMHEEITRLTSTGMPSSLTELITLGRTLKRRAGASWPTSTTPTPATAPPKPSTHPSNTYADPHSGLRNLSHYITRALLETGGFKPQLHPQL